jgi:hypothetical protein
VDDLTKRWVIDDIMGYVRIGLEQETTFSMDRTPELKADLETETMLWTQDLWDLVHMSKYMREQLYQFQPFPHKWYDRIIEPPPLLKYDLKEGF